MNNVNDNGVDVISIPDWLNEVHHHKIWFSKNGRFFEFGEVG